MPVDECCLQDQNWQSSVQLVHFKARQALPYTRPQLTLGDYQIGLCLIPETPE